jgi:hypothetical protein
MKVTEQFQRYEIEHGIPMPDVRQKGVTSELSQKLDELDRGSRLTVRPVGEETLEQVTSRVRNRIYTYKLRRKDNHEDVRDFSTRQEPGNGGEMVVRIYRIL